jgi:hypothetical protein
MPAPKPGSVARTVNCATLVEPLVAVRAVPVVVRGSSDSASEEPVPYDEIDGAVPRGGGVHAQAVAELRQRLLRRGGAELLRLELGQGVRLASPERTAPRAGRGLWEARAAAGVVSRAGFGAFRAHAPRFD